MVFVNKYWSVKTAGYICMSLLNVLDFFRSFLIPVLLIHISPLFPNKALETASCSVPGGVPACSLHHPAPVSQKPSQVYWTGSLVPVRHHPLYQSPLLATRKGKTGGGGGWNKKSKQILSVSSPPATFVSHRSAQARSAHRDMLIEMLFGSRLCPCTNVHKMTN